MKHTNLCAIITIALLGFTGCSPVKFYSNAELTKKSGLKYYTVKPYLQVERDLVNNQVVKATVLYLPDLEHPQYIETKDGIGSRKIDIKLTDGSINTIGIDSDTKIAEAITALTGLVTKTTTAITDMAALKGVPVAAAPSTITELYDITLVNGITSVKRIEIK